ncbi:NUDIX hydrolase [Candidatus Saccharibacteria bacterium]|nr:NUDIX hydrolase [Candidatus Saccharibacteria bacterium]MBI3338136.1 NUDIX hydrolase [Candidatus Saccharibacteria bacterium]
MTRKVKVADEETDHRRGIDHIGVTVCFVVHDGQGNLLLQKRGPKARDEQGRWDIGGGAVEMGELLEDAVRREVLEELGTDPLEIEFITAGDAHREHNGNNTHWVYLLHSVRIDPSTVINKEPHKISEIGWFNADTIPTPMHSQFHKIFDVVKTRGIIK